MARKRQSQSELQIAIDRLADVSKLDERGRIELLIDTQDNLNNGDAMAYFDHWLDAVCDAIEIDRDDFDPMNNPFA
mgnify:CR=1 FL=1|tara:strand:+ start:7633 stop:7860 length:228 start_codon:yes stop_codon:yes gene_type:complete